MNGNDTDALLMEKYTEEMWERTLRGEAIAFEMDLATAAAVLAMLQLALRHPATSGLVAAAQARRVACYIEAVLGITPAAKEACRRGWISDFDWEPK